jgi:hypothetical protein
MTAGRLHAWEMRLLATVREVAGILNLSDDKVRRMFQDEPGVLVLGDEIPKSKRRYVENS